MTNSETPSLLPWVCPQQMANTLTAAFPILVAAGIAFFLDNDGQHFLISPEIHAKFVSKWIQTNSVK